MKTLVDEVNLGSQEQARGVEQISKAIVQIEQVTQRAAASSEQAASASEQLAAQADSNRAILQDLKKLVDASERSLGAKQGLGKRAKSNSLNSRAGRLITPPPESVPSRSARPKNVLSTGKSLNALKAAVHKPAAPARNLAAAPEPAFQMAGRPDASAIPMDDDFREF